jgi:threonyl-tRNA synthetase
MSTDPYARGVGEREAAQRQGTPRRRGGEQLPSMGVEEFLDLLRGETVNPAK